MKTKQVKRVKVISRPSLRDTLKAMKIGEPRKMDTKQFKLSVVRTEASAMKKSGYEFTISEQGLIDEYIITRLK